MKKMIEVDIPDGYHIGSVNICPDTPNLSRLDSYNSDFKELHLPTEGEIAGIIKDESGMKLSYAKALNCARLIINQMKGEE